MSRSNPQHWKLRQQLDLYHGERLKAAQLMESIIGLGDELSMIRGERLRTVDHVRLDRLDLKYAQGQRQLHDLALRHADCETHVRTRRMTIKALCGDFIRSGRSHDELDTMLREAGYTGMDGL